MSYIAKTKVTDEQVKEAATSSEMAARFDDLAAQLDSKAAALHLADSQLQTEINSLREEHISDTSMLEDYITQLHSGLETNTAMLAGNITELHSLLTAEKLQREVSENGLRGEINSAVDAEKTARSQEVQGVKQELTRALEGERARQDSSTAQLQELFSTELVNQSARLDDLSAQLDAESSTRQIESYTLSNKIDIEIQNRIDGDQHLRDEFNNLRNEFETWKIDVSKLAKPAAGITEYTYDGTAKSLLVVNYDEHYMTQSGVLSAVDAGEYAVVYQLKNKNVTSWSDGTTDDVVISWQIKLRPLSAAQSQGFSQSGSMTYNGSVQTVSITNFDSNFHRVTGEYSKTNAGNYTAQVIPAVGYLWNDGTATAKNVTWKINAKAVTKPTATVTLFDYDGAAKTLQVRNYDSSVMTQSGTVTATEAGDYSVKYILKSKTNYVWSGGSVADVVIEWQIGSKLISKPTAASTTFSYSGDAKTLVVANYDSNYIEQKGIVSATNAGEYQAIYHLRNSLRAKWSDGSTADVVINWKIEPVKLTATQSTFAQGSALTYSGANQTVTITNFDSTYHEAAGVRSAVNAGEYEVTITPKANYVWNNGTSAAKVLKWTIGRKQLAKPYAVQSGFDYDGETHRLNIQNYDSNVITAAGTWEASAPGTYQLEFSLKDADNTAWTGGGTGKVQISWTIGSKQLAKPSASITNFTYNGAGKSVAITNYDANYMTQDGTISAVDAGSYSIKYALKDKGTTAWSDGSTGDVVISWQINPAVLTAAQSNLYQKSIPEYTGNQINFKDYMANYDAAKVSMMLPSGSQVNAGSYDVEVRLNNNYTFSDGTRKKTVTMQIGRQKLTTPQVEGDLQYTGGAQSPVIVGFTAGKMTLSGDTSKVEVGSYTVAVTPGSNFCWSDGSYSAVDVAWRIVPARVTIPTWTKSGSEYTIFTFNATERSLEDNITNFDSSVMTKSGELKASASGAHTVTFTLKSANYAWADGTSAPKSLTWSIVKLLIQGVEDLLNSILDFTYDGQTHTINVAKYVSHTEMLTISGTLEAQAKGNYQIILKLKYPASTQFYFKKPKKHYETDDQVINWSIGTIKLDKPTLSQTFFDYDGQQKTLAISGFDSATMTKSGVETASKRGEYTITFKLNDKESYCWSDGSTDDVVYTWSIGITRINEPVISEDTITEYTYDGKAKSISVTGYDSDKMTMTGELSATDAGDYSVTFKLKDKTGCLWSGGGTADITYTWKINRQLLPFDWNALKQINIPTYDREEHSPEFENFDARYLTMEVTPRIYTSNDVSLALAQAAKITPKSNYAWSDGSTATRTVKWKINPRYITIPYIIGASNFEYDGQEHFPDIADGGIGPANYFMIALTADYHGDGYNGEYTSRTQINAGTYRVKYFLTDAGQYDFATHNNPNVLWSDGTTTDKFVEFTISKRSLRVPLQDGAPIMEGGSDGVFATGFFDPNFYNDQFVYPNLKIDGATIQITANNYTRMINGVRRWEVYPTFTLLHPENFQWLRRDGSIIKEDYFQTYFYFDETDIPYPIDGLNASTASVKQLQAENAQLRAAILDLQNAVLDLYYPDNT